jgi:hypothetical protein
MALSDTIIAALTAQGTTPDATYQAWIVASCASYGGTNYLVLKNTNDRIGFNALRTSGTPNEKDADTTSFVTF